MKFSQNTLNQVAGFDGQIIAQKLVFNQKDFWNFSWSSDIQTTGGFVTGTTPLDLTNATLSAQIVRRSITNFCDSRTGLDFTINDYPLVKTAATITESSDQTNEFTCESTELLYEGKPIQFSGTVFGGIDTTTTYYVLAITSTTTFTISTSSGGSELALTSGTGTMSADTIDPQPITLPITNRDDENGTFTMTIDDTAWGIIAGDPDLDINSTEPVCFTGRVKISFPQNGDQPAYDEVVFLLFLITSDGVINNG